MVTDVAITLVLGRLMQVDDDNGEMIDENDSSDGLEGALTRCRVWSSHFPGERASHTLPGQGQARVRLWRYPRYPPPLPL